MTTYGTSYGGWYIPDDVELNENSVVISAGVGEDISFDLAIQAKYNCNIYLVDPTERSVRHFNEVKEFYQGGRKNFSGDIQRDYINVISKIKPDISKIKYINTGLWTGPGTLKFYKQDNPKYVSQSLIPGIFTKEYTTVKVDRLKNLIDQHGIDNVDLVKMDIEGAEIEVLNTMLTDNILPSILCVEFDYLLKGSPNGKELTDDLVKRLEERGYKIVYNEKWNVVFQMGK